LVFRLNKHRKWNRYQFVDYELEVVFGTEEWWWWWMLKQDGREINHKEQRKLKQFNHKIDDNWWKTRESWQESRSKHQNVMKIDEDRREMMNNKW